MKMILTQGISCSGKSTYAKELCDKDESYVEVNRDFIRFNIVCPGSDWSNYKFKSKREKEVTEIQKEMVMDAYAKEKNVIISDTNLNPATVKMWVDIAEDLGYDVEIVQFPISYEEAIKRDALRANGVGHSVIWQQYLKYYKLHNKTYEPNPVLPSAICVDIDGSLALNESGRGWYDWMSVGADTPVEYIVHIVNSFYDAGVAIILLSGRDACCYQVTKDWLDKHGIKHTGLLMREEGDIRKDTIVKNEIFWRDVAPYWNVKFIIDDRACVVREWIAMGLKVLACGDPWTEF